MATLNQPSFTGGEASPSLYGRVDLSRYSTSLKRCENFIVLRQGGVTNRPGTQFMAPAKYSGVAAGSTTGVRLIPFEFSATQTYILEFGHLYVRFYRAGAQVTDTSEGFLYAPWAVGSPYVTGAWVFYPIVGAQAYIALQGGIGHQPDISPTYWAAQDAYEVPTVYTGDEVRDLQYIQSADVMTLVHPNHPPAELRRITGGFWEFATVLFAPDIGAPATLSGIAEDITTTPFRTYQYKVTALNAAGQEGVASPLVTVTGNLQSNKPFVLSWPNVTNAVTYNIYRSRNGVFGLIGGGDGSTPIGTPAWDNATTYDRGDLTTYSGALYFSLVNGTSGAQPDISPAKWRLQAANVFIDENIIPDYATTPPDWTNPFNATGDYPSVVAYYQQRLAFAATNNHPETIWLSRTGDFHNFSSSVPPKDDDAINFVVAAEEVQRVRALLSLKRLLSLTSSASWLIWGDQDGIVTPSAINPEVQGFDGASTIRPVRAGSSALFIHAKGSVVQDLNYSLTDGGLIGTDLSVMANHLFEGHTVVAWAFAKVPHSVVWAVRDDGLLLGFTYMKEQQVWGWHRHTTSGAVLDVAVVSEGDEDAVYLLVQRTAGGNTNRRYVERLHTRYIANSEDAFFVDAGLSYNGAPATAFSGLGHLEGLAVVALADGNVVRGLTVSGGAVTLPSAASVVHIGLPYTATLETLDITAPPSTVRTREKNAYKMTVYVQDSRGGWFGPDTAHLTEFKQRQFEPWDASVDPTTAAVEQNIQSTWDKPGRLVIQQLDPLPMTVLSIMPEVTVGGA